MTYISPILKNRINSTGTNKTPKTPNNRHEKIYQDLTKRANEVRPNEAKATMVKEGILGNPITATKDTFKDGTNFFKAVFTGKIGDNSLGRINDLGLKIGAGIIATFLATHAKTKTDALMKFIGGGAFIASMSLWPKLFINLPARLVHGFRIDRKYISAQGDKKDFGLDNQFLVWDAYPEEQLRKDAKNAGIDYDSKNGKEKIQRKIQKTMLQNRTLWMATAGFATPLMTAMFGNYIEPEVKKAIVGHDVKKAENLLNNSNELQEYIRSQADSTSAKRLQQLIDSYNGKDLDKDFYDKVARLLSFDDMFNSMKDSDNAKPVERYAPDGLIEALKNKQNELAQIDKKDLAEKLAGARKTAERTGATSVEELLSGKVYASLGQDGANAIIEQLNDDFSAQNIKKVLQENDVTDADIQNVLGTVKKDSTKFFEFLKKYNEDVVSQSKAKIKVYLQDLLNPVVGSKTESAYTLEFEKTMKKAFKTLGISNDELRILRGEGYEESSELLAKIIKRNLDEKVTDEDSYKTFLSNLVSKAKEADDNAPKTILGRAKAIISKILKDETFNAMLPEETLDGVNVKELNEAILGGKTTSNGVLNLLKSFIETKQIDLNAAKARPLIWANFEHRLKSGDLKLSDDQLKIARKLIYDGSLATISNKAYVLNENEFKTVVNEVLDATKFVSEKEYMNEIQTVVESMKNICLEGIQTTPQKDYMLNGSLTASMKRFATSLGNNKAWMKIFGPMAIALVAVTLAVQPFFGNIKKEFPDEIKKDGGNK